MEKIIEQYMQDYMLDISSKNKIININHHDGMKGHSTKTAITQIYNDIIINRKRHNTSILLCTNMSAVYDTVDHEILLQKLNYYGFKGKSKRI